MFWKYNNTNSSQIETLLSKEDVTLKEVMDEEDIINECKLQNKALIDFLIKPEIIEELVTLTTVEPSAELDERTRFKYPNVACELLTCDVPALNERLAGDDTLLEKLYMFLDSEPPLNPLLASFFSKIMGVLIAKKTEQNWLSYQFTSLQVLDFLKAKDNFILLLLKHMGTSAIMDLTLKLMTQVEGVEMRQNILNWLDSQRIMQSLVSLIDPNVDNERHYNVAQLLCDFIRTARENLRNSTERNDPDPLLNTLQSSETVSLLLDHMLGENKNESCVVGGIQILLALLDVNRNSNLEEIAVVEQKPPVIQNTITAILARLKDFHEILLNPPKKLPINTTLGILDPPLGNARLQITKLLAALISANNGELMKEIMILGTLQVLLDLFFKFPWNNFLHTQVEICIISSLRANNLSDAGDEDALYKHLLVNCKLVERILDAWKDNDTEQLQAKGFRKGYMGHLTDICNSIAELGTTTSLGQFMKDNLSQVAESFDDFKETTLQETNKTREILLGGAHPNTVNDDNDDFGEIPFSQSSIMQQQMFTQYQIQQLTPHFIETFGFNDDEYNDGDDTLQTLDHRTNMNFDLNESDLVQQHEIFKRVCAQNISTLDDTEDQIFEEREHTVQTVIEKPGERHDAVYSSDSEDDESPPPEDPFMDIDPWSSPHKDSDVLVLSDDPWGKLEKAVLKENATSWADFSSASFANFDVNFTKVQHKRHSATANNTTVERDLILENVDVDGIAEEKNCNAEVKAESVENVAQIVTEAVEEVKKVIGGHGEGINANTETVLQPSITTTITLPTVEEDSFANKTGSNSELETEH